MPYWRLYYHFVWATKERRPLITPEIEDQVYKVIAHKCSQLGGWAYAVNGMPDHIHVIAAVPPRMSPAEIARNLKGASGHFVQNEIDIPFRWQRGYGVFSLSQRGLDTAAAYVRNQKEHHRSGSLIKPLEITADVDNAPPGV